MAADVKITAEWDGKPLDDGLDRLDRKLAETTAQAEKTAAALDKVAAKPAAGGGGAFGGKAGEAAAGPFAALGAAGADPLADLKASFKTLNVEATALTTNVAATATELTALPGVLGQVAAFIGPQGLFVLGTTAVLGAVKLLTDHWEANAKAAEAARKEIEQQARAVAELAKHAAEYARQMALALRTPAELAKGQAGANFLDTLFSLDKGGRNLQSMIRQHPDFSEGLDKARAGDLRAQEQVSFMMQQSAPRIVEFTKAVQALVKRGDELAPDDRDLKDRLATLIDVISEASRGGALNTAMVRTGRGLDAGAALLGEIEKEMTARREQATLAEMTAATDAAALTQMDKENKQRDQFIDEGVALVEKQKALGVGMDDALTAIETALKDTLGEAALRQVLQGIRDAVGAEKTGIQKLNDAIAEETRLRKEAAALEREAADIQKRLNDQKAKEEAAARAEEQKRDEALVTQQLLQQAVDLLDKLNGHTDQLRQRLFQEFRHQGMDPVQAMNRANLIADKAQAQLDQRGEADKMQAGVAGAAGKMAMGDMMKRAVAEAQAQAEELGLKFGPKERREAQDKARREFRDQQQQERDDDLERRGIQRRGPLTPAQEAARRKRIEGQQPAEAAAPEDNAGQEAADAANAAANAAQQMLASAQQLGHMVVAAMNAMTGAFDAIAANNDGQRDAIVQTMQNLPGPGSFA